MTWENMPSHICRGGDLRGLTFCCPPVKPCPIMGALREAGLSPEEYVEIKTKFANETRLGEGPGTCFGSLVWCCKPTKPCPLRDMSMRNINMSVEEYTNLKKQLSEKLLAKSNVKDSNDENVEALIDAFQINKNEAKKVLADCGNDLRMAIKILRVKSLNEDS